MLPQKVSLLLFPLCFPSTVPTLSQFCPHCFVSPFTSFLEPTRRELSKFLTIFFQLREVNCLMEASEEHCKRYVAVLHCQDHKWKTRGQRWDLCFLSAMSCKIHPPHLAKVDYSGSDSLLSYNVYK